MSDDPAAAPEPEAPAAAPSHVHDFRILRRVRAPVGPAPGHTEFVALFCRCGRFDVFPRSNYDLADAEFRAAFEEGFTRLGWKWAE
jgi:hypothetical protein